MLRIKSVFSIQSLSIRKIHILFYFHIKNEEERIDMGYKLRDYQQECVDAVKALPNGARSVVVMATGLGKTFTASNFDFQGRVLWISHRDELVRQPEKFFRMRGLSYGIEKADEHSNGEDVISASIQSICKPKRLSMFKPDDFDTIIVDEAQHAAAPTYRKVLSYFRPRHLIGLTATPQRGDKVRLTDVFDDICYTRDLKWGIQNHYLSRVRCVRVSADFDMESMHLTLGDYSAKELDESMMISNNDIVVTKAYLDYSVPERLQTLIYCPKVSTCERVVATIRKAIPEADKDTVQMIWDGMSPDERRDILERYRQHKVLCIVNCMILTEGVDLPDTRVVIVDRPTTNAGLYTQIVGRGTRLAEGKKYCLVVDVVGKHYLQRQICTAPTLFGIEPAALPERIRKKLEKTDLLDVADTIITEQAKQAKGAALLREMIDIFTQEKVAIINDNKEKGLKAIADAYDDRLREGTNLGKEFSDIIVKETPSLMRRYKIEPSFTGGIYLSEPDMLGKTVVEFDIPEAQYGIPGIFCKSAPMPVKDASALIHDILQYIFPEWTRMKWSRTGRDAQKKIDATDKQTIRIQKEYSRDGVKQNRQQKPLNRLQASDLIDLKIELKNLEEQRKKYQEQEKKKYPAQDTAGEGLLLEDDEKAKEEARGKQWDSVMFLVRPVVEKRKQEEEKSRKQVLAQYGQHPSFIVRCTSEYAHGTMPASMKQISYVQNMVYKLSVRNIVCDIDPMKNIASISKWKIGFVISYFRTATALIQTNSNARIIMEYKTFLDQINRLRPQDCPVEIKCYYHLDTAK